MENNLWHGLAARALEGQPISPAEALAVLRAPDDELLDQLAAAYHVRRHYHGNRVHLNYLINAKSGQCGEDCGYCSQSRISQADIPRYRLLDADALFAGAETAALRRATTYCIVLSGRSPTPADMDVLGRVGPRVKSELPLRLCASVGLLDDRQAAELRAAGVDRVNHNLNTSRRFYPQICTTHDYQQRLDTLAAVRRAGMEICSGGIVGMGETDEDVADLALCLASQQVEALPVNFYLPIPGTPASTQARPLDPKHCLRCLVLFRLANPRAELRIAAGREVHLRSLQPLGLYAADSIFVGDYLTTQGQAAEDDYRMIADLGFEAVCDGMAGA